MSKSELTKELKNSIKSQQLDRIIELIEKGADTNVTHFESKKPILIHMVEDEYYGWSIKVIKAIIEGGADLERTDRSGRTAMSYACQQGSWEIFKLLLDAGASLESNEPLSIWCCGFGYDFIDLATEQSRFKILSSLIENGQDINSFDKNKEYNPLILAVDNNCRLLVNLLLDSNCDINQINKQGNTAIMYACGDATPSKRRGGFYPTWTENEAQFPIVKSLILQGADLLIKNNGNRTALTIALSSKQYDTAYYLATKLSDKNLLDKKEIYRFKDSTYFERVKNFPYK